MTNSRWQKSALAAAVPRSSSRRLAWEGAGGEAPWRAVKTVVLPGTGGSLDREFAADIHARKESRLGSVWAAKCRRAMWSWGAFIKEGQVLARLDPQAPPTGAREAARAGVAAAEANAAQATADLKRFTELKALRFQRR